MTKIRSNNCSVEHELLCVKKTKNSLLTLFNPKLLKHFIYSLFLFFLSGFSFTKLAIHTRAGEGRGQLFIPLCYFHPLTNIQKLFFQLCMWNDYYVFLIVSLITVRLLAYHCQVARLLLFIPSPTALHICNKLDSISDKEKNWNYSKYIL